MKKAIIYTLQGLKYEITYEYSSSTAYSILFTNVQGKRNDNVQIELKFLEVPVMNSVVEFQKQEE